MTQDKSQGKQPGQPEQEQLDPRTREELEREQRLDQRLDTNQQEDGRERQGAQNQTATQHDGNPRTPKDPTQPVNPQDDTTTKQR